MGRDPRWVLRRDVLQPATKVPIYVDGELTTGNPRAIQLTNQSEIPTVIGTPPPQIPKTADFSTA